MKRSKVASVAFTGAAAAATVGFATQPAAAAPASTWHITPGGAFTATNSGTPVLVDTTTGASLTCTTAGAAGNLSGDGRTGASVQLGTINTATFGTSANPCSLLGINFTAKLNNATTLSGSSYANGVTKGHIGNGTTSNINATVTGLNVSCHAVIVGSKLPGSFINSTNTLNINPGHAATLTVKSVSGCLGAMNPGDKAYFAAKYKPNPAQTITES